MDPYYKTIRSFLWGVVIIVFLLAIVGAALGQCGIGDQANG